MLSQNWGPPVSDVQIDRTRKNLELFRSLKFQGRRLVPKEKLQIRKWSPRSYISNDCNGQRLMFEQASYKLAVKRCLEPSFRHCFQDQHQTSKDSTLPLLSTNCNTMSQKELWSSNKEMSLCQVITCKYWSMARARRIHLILIHFATHCPSILNKSTSRFWLEFQRLQNHTVSFTWTMLLSQTLCCYSKSEIMQNNFVIIKSNSTSIPMIIPQ